MHDKNEQRTSYERINGVNLRNMDESKTAYLLYNGGIEADEDPADYMMPIKGARLA